MFQKIFCVKVGMAEYSHTGSIVNVNDGFHHGIGRVHNKTTGKEVKGTTTKGETEVNNVFKVELLPGLRIGLVGGLV